MASHPSEKGGGGLGGKRHGKPFRMSRRHDSFLLGLDWDLRAAKSGEKICR